MTRIVNPISPSGLFLRNPISPFTGPVAGSLPPLPTGGMLAHLDSSDPDNTDAVNDSDPIGSLLDDLSGLNNDFSQTTGAQKPLYKLAIKNGLNVPRYDGSNDNLTRASDVDFEVDNFSIYVVSRKDTGGDGVFCSFQSSIGGPGSRGFVFDTNLSKLRCIVADSPTSFHETFSTNNAGSGWHIYAAIKFGSTVTIYKDGLQDGQETDAPVSINYAGTPKVNSIGAQILSGSPVAPHAGDLPQIAVYGIAHSGSIIGIVHNILSQKWAIALA